MQNYKLEELYKLQYQHVLNTHNFSNKTNSMYLGAFMRFIKHKGYKHPVFVKNEDIKDYLLLHREKSSSMQDNMINAFKFFFGKVHSHHISESCIIRPRKKQFLPDYFSTEEISLILSATNNIKHKLLLSIIYGAGLRRSEARNLLMEHIDLKRNVILVKDAKGGKDRYTLLSHNIKTLLHEYLRNNFV